MSQISDLFWVMLVLSGIIFLFVCTFLFVNVVRFSARPDAPEPTQVFGHRRVELAWTLIPTVILLIAFVVTVVYIHNINSPPKGATAATIMNIKVVGHQWWWEFQYPPQPQVRALGITKPIVTADELHLPTGIPLHFHVTSADVIHSFWTPQLQRQIDANPGIDNAVFVELNRPGIYGGACYEYCGDAHAWMKYRVVVQTPAQFRAWVLNQIKPAAKPHGLAAQGQKVFYQNTCISCHFVDAPRSPAHGTVGPNLTHLGIRWTIGAGAAPLTTTDLMAWIRDPNSYKPGVLMPPYPLISQKDLRALAAYLISLK